MKTMPVEKVESKDYEALRKSEAMLRAIVENSRDAIEVSSEGLHVYGNAALLKLFRIADTAQFAGVPILDFIAPDRRGQVEAGIAHRAAGKRDSMFYETRGRRRDGGEFDLEISSTAFELEGAPYSLSVMRDVTGRKGADEMILSLLEGMDVLLKEVHHRMKNNMSAIGSILSVHASTLRSPEAISALEEAEGRLRIMTILYDKLYRLEGYGDIRAREYFPDLVGEILSNFPFAESLRVETRFDDFLIDARRLSTLSIIVNELLTNTMKYAFAGRAEGSVAVIAELKGGDVALRVEDDGVGIPAALSIEGSAGFGLALVRILAKQLNASLRMERGIGTRTSLEFEL
jgi:PAS domain S-box-containing protein